MKTLSVKNISKHFGGVTALENCSFDVSEGEILGLIGPNGSGKTTMFNVITGIHKANSGKVFLKGENIMGWKTHQIGRASCRERV